MLKQIYIFMFICFHLTNMDLSIHDCTTKLGDQHMQQELRITF